MELTFTDNGTVTFGSGDTMTLYGSFSTQQIVVGSGGLLTAAGTTFNSFGSSITSLIVVNAGGHLQASNSTFSSSLSQVNLNTGSILNAGDLTGNSFNCPLFVPENELQYLSGSGSNNAQFQAIEIQAGNVPSGQTVALNLIGTLTTVNLYYVFQAGFTVSSGATLNVAANVDVQLFSGLTLTDNGTVNFASGDTMTLYGSFSTQQIVIGNGGLLTAAGTTFNSFGSSFTSLIVVNAGGQLQVSNSDFSIIQLNLANGSNEVLGENFISCPLAINSGAQINIHQNDLTGATVTASGPTGGAIDLTNNYWGTTSITAIESQITTYTNGVLPVVSFQPFLTARPVQTVGVPATTTYSGAGESVPLSATVTSPSGIVNVGTVTFSVFNGGTQVGSQAVGNVVNGSATASYQVPAVTPAGAYTIKATYADSSSTFDSAISNSAVLVVNSVPVATTQPSNQTINAGGNTSFSAAASGFPTPTVQWEVSTNNGASFAPLSNGGVYSGVTTGALIITGASGAMNGYQYEAVFTNSVGSAPSSAATLTVNTVPAVTTQPVGQAVNAGTTATFTAAGAGNPSPSVQWQLSIDGGNTFNPLSNAGAYSGATTGTLTITGAAAAMNGFVFEAIFTNTVGSATTSAVALTINSAPAVTTQPVSQTVNAGATTTFTAAGVGNPAPSVQWQVSTNNGASFAPLGNGGVYSGVTTSVLTITGASGAMNGYQYEAVFANLAGSIPSSAATLTVNTGPAVTTQPVGQAVNAGTTATFTAAGAANPAATMQWQVSTDGGNTFNPLSNGGAYSGVATGTLTITGVAAFMNGFVFEAIFTNTVGSATTSAVALTINTAPAVTTQPVSQAVNAGATTTFIAAAVGKPAPSVQWQVSTNNGASFAPLGNGGVYSGVTTSALTITGASGAMNGYQYEAVFTNFIGSAPSSAATLTVDTMPAVTTQPVSQAANTGATTTFTAAASGNPAPTVQWYLSTSGLSGPFNPLSNGGAYGGVTTGTLTITGAATAMNGYDFEAVFTNSVGSATSNVVTLTVDFGPSVMTQPASQTVISGNTATFTIAAAGNPAPSVQWQMSADNGADWSPISGATSPTLALTNVGFAQNGYEYEATVTNSGGSAVTNAASLTVNTVPALTTQPLGQTVNAGLNASFTAAASGNPAPTVQWYVSASGPSGPFNPLSNGGAYGGVTTGTLTIAGATATMNGDDYEAIFANSAGSTTSNVGTLTVDIAPSVTTQPTSQTVTAGNTATFTAAASGNPAPSMQWQVSTNGGTTFNAVSNGGVYSDATTGTLTITGATAAMNGYEYNCAFTNSVGDVSSSPAILSVNVALGVNRNTANLAANATTLTITGSGFSATNTNDSVVLSGSARSGPSPARRRRR